MSKFFGYVNELRSHKKPRQSELALKKYWVNTCGWLRLSTKVDMGMTITNSWKLFCCGFKRDHHEIFIGIREF